MKLTTRLFVGCLVCSLTVVQSTVGHAQTRTELKLLPDADQAKPKWMLRTLSDVTVGSPIVRLGDLVTPIDPQSTVWNRLRSAPIAMFPVNRDSMTVDRSRLDRAIRKTERNQTTIQWLGPQQINVRYRRSAAAKAPTTQARSTSIAQASFATDDVANSVTDASNPLLNAGEFQRITHWIRLAIKRDQPRIADSFEIKFDREQSGLSELQSINGVTSTRPIDTPEPGQCRFQVVGRSVRGPIQSIVFARLTALPTVVVPRTTLARGHRITATDLLVAPIAIDRHDTGYAIDPSQLIGLEVRKTLRADQPIAVADVGAPILVHRGDLLEVRVISGGVVVTTNAKALGDGAEADLIEIETMRPKKRVIARVVHTGLVEIVTRTPSLNYREQPR